MWNTPVLTKTKTKFFFLYESWNFWFDSFVNEKYIFKFQSHLYAKLILFWYRLISVIIAEYFEWLVFFHFVDKFIFKSQEIETFPVTFSPILHIPISCCFVLKRLSASCWIKKRKAIELFQYAAEYTMQNNKLLYLIF